jgi:hypothetical protein
LLPSIEADPAETRERWFEHPLGSLRHVLAAKVTAAIYAGVSSKAKAQIASKLVDAGFGS